MTRIKDDLINLESVLVILFFITTVGMLIGSFRLNSESSKLFPRLTGGIVLILFIILFGVRLAPSKILESIPEKDTISYGENDIQNEEFNEHEIYLVFLMFGGYIFGVYLVGFLISTLLYLYTNLWYYKYGSWKQKSAIIFIAFIVLIVAYESFRIPIDQGVLV